MFVDEYQDVNLVQEELLGLVGGEEVFLVGDAKPAIYAFRGSRSRYFLQNTIEIPSVLWYFLCRFISCKICRFDILYKVRKNMPQPIPGL